MAFLFIPLFFFSSLPHPQIVFKDQKQVPLASLSFVLLLLSAALRTQSELGKSALSLAPLCVPHQRNPSILGDVPLCP